jgi:phage head maturation protease
MTTTAPETVTMEAAAPAGTVFSVDVEKRTIRGLAVPFGVEGLKEGKRFVFSRESLQPYLDNPSRVKLWIGHDKTTACGVAFELTPTDEGLEAAFKVARGAKGDEALTMADDGVWDGMSLGPSEGAKYRIRDGIYHAADIPFHEISLTPAPVFGGARVRSVAFDAEQENSGMTATDTEVEVTAEPQTFDVTPISDAIRDGFANLTLPQGDGPERISATDGLEVTEPTPYRFDGFPGAHSFVQDLQEANRDSDARTRLDGFLEELQTFAVSTTNTAGLNPVQNRPDLYVPNLTFTRPLWELVSTGAITDKTAFTVPKFSSASGLVGAHTEGTEPTPGAFAATTQTVTPGAKSGKIEINREAWDQGGSPQADGIIWSEMLNGWYEAIEADIATTLAAVGTAELNLASAVDAALVGALTNYLAGLQFVRGGNRFTAFAADGNLFPALVAAKDDAGRPLLPVIGPQNAQGSTGGGFDRVQLGNLPIRAAWALGTGNDKKSYNFVPTSVWAWASTPKRFTFEYQVKSIDMAIWGYAASAVLRASDVKPVDYTTADS